MADQRLRCLVTGRPAGYRRPSGAPTAGARLLGAGAGPQSGQAGESAVARPHRGGPWRSGRRRFPGCRLRRHRRHLLPRALDGLREGLRRRGAPGSPERGGRRSLKAGVRRIVYLSGLHPEGTELSTHLGSRTTVGEILIASGIETIVLQAGVVVGSGSASFEMIRHLTDRLPVMTTPKWVHQQDSAHRDSRCAAPSGGRGDLPGPQVPDLGHRRTRRARVRRHDADLRRGGRIASTPNPGSAGAHTANRRAVGGPGDAHSPRGWPARWWSPCTAMR